MVTSIWSHPSNKNIPVSRNEVTAAGSTGRTGTGDSTPIGLNFAGTLACKACTSRCDHWRFKDWAGGGSFHLSPQPESWRSPREVFPGLTKAPEAIWPNPGLTKWQNAMTELRTTSLFINGSESMFIKNHIIYRHISVHQDDAVFRCHSQRLLLVPVQFFPGKDNEKGLQKTMQVKRNACLAVNCKLSNNWSSKGPQFHHTPQQLHCSARVICSHLDV